MGTCHMEPYLTAWRICPHRHTSAIKRKTTVLLEARITMARAIENLEVSKNLEAGLNEAQMDVP